MRRPAPVAIASATLLMVAGIPFWGVKFISVDDALKQQFPPNRTTPLEVVVGAPAGSQQVKALAMRIERLPTSRPWLRRGRPVAASRCSWSRRSRDHSPAQVRSSCTTSTGCSGRPRAQARGSPAARHSDRNRVDARDRVLMTGSVVLPIKAVLINALTLIAMFGILVLI